MNRSFHEPVLLTETMNLLLVKSEGRYIDATWGGGGHGQEMARRGGRVLGIDVDREAVEFAKENLKSQISMTNKEKDLIVEWGNFRDLEKITREAGFTDVDGVLFDLGISSHQLDTPERGFSFRRVGPFDLRLDQSKGEPASYFINYLSEGELYEIMATLAEEEYARAISLAFTRARALKPLLTTEDVYDVIAKIAKWDPDGTAARVFQAFRMYVNDERDALKSGLEAAEKLVKSGGRVAVISFHSLEDRMVKLFFQRASFRIITKKPLIAGEEERENNSRSRSAKLRVAEKV